MSACESGGTRPVHRCRAPSGRAGRAVVTSGHCVALLLLVPDDSVGGHRARCPSRLGGTGFSPAALRTWTHDEAAIPGPWWRWSQQRGSRPPLSLPLVPPAPPPGLYPRPDVLPANFMLLQWPEAPSATFGGTSGCTRGEAVPVPATVTDDHGLGAKAVRFSRLRRLEPGTGPWGARLLGAHAGFLPCPHVSS